MASLTSTDLSRRGLVAAAGLALLARVGFASATTPVALEVWKDPGCGCCKDWVAHLEANGFKVIAHDSGNNAIRSRLGIERKYASCHTGIVGGYAIEGHVPAAQIQRLLREKPKALGLAVPGMPLGAPGMDGEVYDGRKDAFDVMLLARDGSATIYQHYEGKKT